MTSTIVYSASTLPNCKDDCKPRAFLILRSGRAVLAPYLSPPPTEIPEHSAVIHLAYSVSWSQLHVPSAVGQLLDTNHRANRHATTSLRLTELCCHYHLRGQLQRLPLAKLAIQAWTRQCLPSLTQWFCLVHTCPPRQ